MKVEVAVLGSPVLYGLCGRKATLDIELLNLRSLDYWRSRQLLFPQIINPPPSNCTDPTFVFSCRYQRVLATGSQQLHV